MQTSTARRGARWPVAGRASARDCLRYALGARGSSRPRRGWPGRFASMTSGRSLRSLISADGVLRLSLVEREVPEPSGSQVVVAVEASPINPSDLGVLLGAVDAAGLRIDGADVVGEVPAAA